MSDKRLVTSKDELAELRLRVRELEENQRDEAALKELILNTIVEDIQTKGSGCVLSELTRHAHEQ